MVTLTHDRDAAAPSSEPKLVVAVFRSVQNLPVFAAKSKGFYSRHRVDVDIHFVSDSNDLRGGLASGRYEVAHSAIDNAFALKDSSEADVAVVAGGDNSMNSLFVQPDIGSLADIKGKVVAVDAVNTAYAFQLYEMLRQKGLEKHEYVVKSVGGTNLRMAAMKEDKSLVASMMSPPFSILAMKCGLKEVASVQDTLGPYQGATTFVTRKWAADNAEVLVQYLKGDIEGFRWVLDPTNRSEAIALIEEWLKISPDIASESYDAMSGGFSIDGQIDLSGVQTVLDLRARYGDGKPEAAERYLDFSYYQQALSGLPQKR
jgi:ABC-type nitrate/sulfonate/bicarbonate transport system substrate-binding protein